MGEPTAAVAAAVEVDRERGWMHEDGTPAGYGDSLGTLVMKLKTEISGPVGSGRE